MKHLLLALPLVFAAALAAAPFSASEYVTLDDEAQPLRERFNAAAGKVRIVAYVAPTCGGCLRGVDEMQEEVLERIDSSDLEVFVVWVRKNGARERHVGRVTRLADDPRATHYWDEQRAVLKPMEDLLELGDRACAGAFLLYDRGTQWNDATPPAPVYWSDAHSREFSRHGPEFDPDRFHAEVRDLLD